MAEMELSIQSLQCISRRFDSFYRSGRTIQAWQAQCNKLALGANCEFSTQDARIKLEKALLRPTRQMATYGLRRLRVPEQ